MNSIQRMIQNGLPMPSHDTNSSPALTAGVILILALSVVGCGPGDGSSTPDIAPEASTTTSQTPAAEVDRADAAPEVSLRFVDGTQASGIDFTHLPTYTEDRFMPEIQGGGVAIFDANRDGAPDVLALNSGALRSETRPAAGSSRFFLNDGSGLFTDVSSEWGLDGLEVDYGMGVAVGDVDGDGWTDVFLTVYGDGEKLLRNTGSGFEDITASAGIPPDPEWSTSAGMLDLENDGDLDIYAARYSVYVLDDVQDCYEGDLHIYCTPHLVDAIPDRLLRNDGGTFVDVGDEVGLSGRLGRGLALSIGDIDQDGDSDIYVANDLSPNHLWLNDGAGALEDVGPRSGVAMSVEGIDEAGMGADMGDVDGDGRLDLVNSNFEGETTNVHLQGDDLIFMEVSDRSGVGTTARARLSWGIDLFDADNDGDEDLLVANGHIYDNAGEFAGGPTFPQQNTLYENTGDGTFMDVSDLSGDGLADRQVSRGLATSDLDGDGYLDAIVGNNGGTMQVLRNESGTVGAGAGQGAGRWVGLWLEGAGQGADTSAGPGVNRSAIGARVEARIGSNTLIRQVSGGSSYVSAGDFRVHLGLGESEMIDELTIFWPGGGTQIVEGLLADGYYRIVQGAEPEPFTPGERVIEP